MTRRRRQAGSLLVEFAGSLIVLSTLFAGMFQVGYAFYSYEELVNAVRAGARYASLAGGPEAEPAVRNLVVFGETAPAQGARPIVAGLKPEQVEVVWEPGMSTVTIRGFEIDSLFAKFKLDGRPTVTFPRTKAAAQ
jgi:Flp pilus assembly protein TadG